MRIMPFMKRKKGVQFAGTGLDIGGGGTTDYTDLSNKPQINNVTLTGNKTLADLGAQSALTFDDAPVANSNNPVKSGGIAASLSGKMGTKLTTTQIGSAPTSDETTIVTNIAQWVATNNFIGVLIFDYYGTWTGQLISTYDSDRGSYGITVFNQKGERYYISVSNTGNVNVARKITGTVTPIIN